MTDTITIPAREVASYGLTIDREPGAEHLHFDPESAEPDYRTLYLQERELRLSYEGEVDMLKSETRRLEAENNRLTSAPLATPVGLGGWDYDPRLITIATKAARVAENANMCPVYDLVARGCGMPDRYWLEAHGYVTAREF